MAAGVDEASLHSSLAQLAEQEEALGGLLALNPQSQRLEQLLSHVEQAKEATQSALLALRQSRLLESLESMASPPSPPKCSIAPVGSAVSVRHAESGKYFPARIEAHVTPSVARVSWLYAPRSTPSFYTTDQAIVALIEPDYGALVNGARCLVQLTPGEDAWCCGCLVACGGDSRPLACEG